MFAFNEKQLALSDLKPWSYLIDNGIIVNKNGSICAGFTYFGQDIDNLTEEARTNIATLLNQAFKMFGNGYMIHSDVIRKSTSLINHTNSNYFNNEVAIKIDEERIKHFSNDSCFISKYIIVITYFPTITQKNKFAEKFFTNYHVEQNSSLDFIIRNFKLKLNEFENLVSNILNIKRLSTTSITDEYLEDELCNHLNETICCYNQELLIPRGYALDEILGNQDFIGGIYPKIGEKHLAIISIDEFPNFTHENILHVIDNFPFDFRWNTRFIFADKHQTEKIIRKQQRLWDSEVRKITDLLYEKIFGSPRGRNNRDAENMSEDSEIAITDAREGAVKFGYYTSTVILYDENVEILKQKAEIVIKEIQTLKFNARLEQINAMDAFFGSLAGSSKAFNVREPIIHTLNLAHLIHTSSVYIGEKTSPNPFLPANSPPLAMAITHGNTPYYFNLHVQDVGHTCIIGQIGSGKSTLLAFIIAQYQRYKNTKIFAFDQRLSLFAITKACNGNHYDIGENKTLQFCPLALVEDNASKSWATEYIIGLIEMQGQNVNSQQKQMLMLAINSVSKQKNRSLSELLPHIQDENIKLAIKQYTKHGSLGGIIDGSHNSINPNNITTFELQALLNMGEKNIIAVITFLFYWIEKQLDNSPSLIVLDECWIILMRSWFKDKFLEWLKTLRKMNCAVVFATQSLSDFTENSKTFSNILEACATKIFLPNSNAGQKGTDKLIGLYELYKSFGLNDAQIDIIKKAQHKREYFVSSKLGSRLISFELDKTAKVFCCSGIEKVPYIKELINQYPDNWQNVYLEQAAGI